MRITKDEAAVLCECLKEYKEELVSYVFTYSEHPLIINSLQELENRLYNYSKDKRRTGRTSQNSFSDILKRLHKSEQSQTNKNQ
jgi:hypothetical protein